MSTHFPFPGKETKRSLHRHIRKILIASAGVGEDGAEPTGPRLARRVRRRNRDNSRERCSIISQLMTKDASKPSGLGTATEGKEKTLLAVEVADHSGERGISRQRGPRSGSLLMSRFLPRLRAFSRRRGLAVSRGLEMQLQVIQLAHTFRVQCTQLLVNGGLSWPFARWRVVAEIPLHRLEGG